MSALPGLLGLIELPGLLLCLAATRWRPTLLQLVVLPPALGLLFAPALALLLASVNCFGLRQQLAAQTLLLAPVAIFLLRARGPRLDLPAWRAELRQNRGEYAALLGLVLLVAAAATPPSEWVLSERMDAANYVVQAAYQARHESLFFADAQPDVYAADFPQAVWHLNSTSGTPLAPGLRQFPFPPFFRALLALMLGLGGLPLLLHTPLVLGLLSGLCAHLALVGLLRSRLAALQASALLLGSPLLVQFMRVTMAEVCFLLATTTALALLALAHASGSRAAALLAGLALALGPLMRADALLVYAGGLLALSAGLLAERDPGGLARTFAPAFLVGSAAAWLLAMRSASTYLAAELRGRSWPVTAVLLGAAAAVCLLQLGQRMAWGERLAILRPPARALLRLLVLGVAALALVRLVGQPLLDGLHTLRSLGAQLGGPPGPGVSEQLATLAYLSLPTVLLGVCGLVLLAVEGEAQALTWAALFALGAAVFLHDPHHMPGVYWSSRRSLAHLLPLLALGCGLALARLQAGWRTPARAALALLLAGSLLAHNALITFRNGIHYQGAAASLAALAQRFETRDVVLVDGRAASADALQLGLRYLHGREALCPHLDSVSDAQLVAFWSRLDAAGRALHVLADSPAAAARLAALFELRTRAVSLGYRHWVHGQAREERLSWIDCWILRARSAPPGNEGP